MRESRQFQEQEIRPPVAERASVEQEIAAAYVEYLIEQAVKINEGLEGIVCKVDLSGLDEETAEVIRAQTGLTVEGDLAVKMLKIYPKATHQGARILEEGRIHRRAYELIGQQPQGESMAEIPRVYFCDEVTIDSAAVLEKLKGEGIAIAEDRKVEVLFMDFIPGEDLATYLYHEVARRHPKLADLKQRIAGGERIPFAEISERVQAALGFNVAADRLDPIQQRRVENENHKRMVDFLYKSGFVLDRSFLESIDRAVGVLNKGGVKHNDLHERNVMGLVTPDNRLERPFIIDFGKSEIKDPSGFAFSAKDEFLDDRYLAQTYRRLTTTAGEREAQERMGVFSLSQALIERRHKEGFEALMEQISALGSEKFEEALRMVDAFIVTTARIRPSSPSGQENFWNLKGLILYELSKQRPQWNEQIARFIDQARVPQAIMNMLKKVKPGLEPRP